MRLPAFIVGFLLLSLAGCANHNSGRIVLRMADWGAAGDDGEFDHLVQSIYRDFEMQNPDIELRIEHIPGSADYVKKMLLNFIAGSEPDIMRLDASSSASFINNGVLLDMGPQTKSDPTFQRADFFESVFAIGCRGEAVYAIPADFTPMVIYYNKRLFKEAGVPLPTGVWTFEQFRNAARKLTKSGQFGFSFANWMPGWIPWLWNNGGDVLSADGSRAAGAFDGPKSVQTIEFLRDLIEKDKCSPSLSQAAATGVDLFVEGRAAMAPNGHWALVGYRSQTGESHPGKLRPEEIGIAAWPSNLGASQTVMYQSGYAIGKNSKHKEAAWRFIKYMTSREVQRKYQSSGIAICARKDVAQELAAKDDLEKAFMSIVPNCRAAWGTRVEGYDNVETEGTNMMDNVLKGGMPPTQALRQAAKAIDEDFALR